MTLKHVKVNKPSNPQTDNLENVAPFIPLPRIPLLHRSVVGDINWGGFVVHIERVKVRTQSDIDYMNSCDNAERESDKTFLTFDFAPIIVEPVETTLTGDITDIE